MTAAIAVCPDCPTARDRARASLGACVYVCTCGREHRARVVRVYRVDPDAPPPEHAPLDRAAATATALRAEDPELARVRVVLADLRPDHPDPDDGGTGGGKPLRARRLDLRVILGEGPRTTAPEPLARIEDGRDRRP